MDFQLCFPNIRLGIDRLDYNWALYLPPNRDCELKKHMTVQSYSLDTIIMILHEAVLQ